MATYKIIIVLLVVMTFKLDIYSQETRSRISEYSSGYSQSSSANQDVQIFSTVGIPIMGISTNSMIKVNSGKDYIKNNFLELGKIAGENRNEPYLPKAFKLYENYPNPFNPETIIKYEIAEYSLINITLFDILGNKIETLLSEEKPAGVYTLEFNAANLPSGIYFYRISAGPFVKTKKMMLLK